ncbi:uncharacterized protein I206_106861 [Kwoniella pini CBS 10737]|uniref:Uncharacterized protein n=1 Tax=Kwoniella pini CBS 10737 TaxID=1296096 RepID=A0A1B9HZW3_9TREE|nr:uncharacterized protein I206_05593 [Kwoniella pini CBS 10737]OCF48812.1 hypothetical protein I206_05593 [Kwoniella pini CBS 10737]
MVRPSFSLGFIANSIIRSTQRVKKQPIPFELQQEQLLNQKAAKCILLHDLPRTVLPSDIERVLKNSGAVDDSFSSSSITTLPPSLPKSPSLYRTVHITLSNHKKAIDLINSLNSKPIFTTTTTSSSSTTENRIKRQAQLTHLNSNLWISNILLKTLQFDKDKNNFNNNKEFENTFTAEWCLKSGLRGRRVILKGLPNNIKINQVKKLGKDCGILDEFEGCLKLPSSRQSQVSTYCLTTQTINDAHRLARKLHMKWYKVDLYDQQWLMRAHVHY